VVIDLQHVSIKTAFR